jgi:hypothetical protein
MPTLRSCTSVTWLALSSTWVAHIRQLPDHCLLSIFSVCISLDLSVNCTTPLTPLSYHSWLGCCCSSRDWCRNNQRSFPERARSPAMAVSLVLPLLGAHVQLPTVSLVTLCCFFRCRCRSSFRRVHRTNNRCQIYLHCHERNMRDSHLDRYSVSEGNLRSSYSHATWA